jgi:hypothetical protein
LGLLRIVLAIGLGMAIWWISMYFIRMLGTPPPEVDPEDVVPTDQDYRCTVCGTELTVKMANNTQPAPPRHCREEMVAVWRPV